MVEAEKPRYVSHLTIVTVVLQPALLVSEVRACHDVLEPRFSMMDCIVFWRPVEDLVGRAYPGMLFESSMSREGFKGITLRVCLEKAREPSSTSRLYIVMIEN